MVKGKKGGYITKKKGRREKKKVWDESNDNEMRRKKQGRRERLCVCILQGFSFSVGFQKATLL